MKKLLIYIIPLSSWGLLSIVITNLIMKQPLLANWWIAVAVIMSYVIYNWKKIFPGKCNVHVESKTFTTDIRHEQLKERILFLENQLRRVKTIAEDSRDRYLNQCVEVEKLVKLRALHEEYIKFLGDELNEIAPHASLNGWESSRHDEGVKLRNEIEQIKSQIKS